VGGFVGPSPSPELFLRWVQNGIFLPRFTIHSWKPGIRTTEPWMYPQILSKVRAAILFRYRLIPYLYNLEVEAALTGHPILRPLVYQFPDDPQCVDESFDFMLGPSLLVASVTASRVRHREVYLPGGQHWYDFYTGQTYAGGQTVTAEAPLDHIPLFVPEGGMIPMGEVVHPLYRVKDDVRRVLVYPHLHNGSSELALTEDDGHSLAYQRGESTTLHLSLSSTPQSLEIRLSLSPYHYPLPFRELEIVLPAGELRKVSLSNVSREWSDGQNRRHLSVGIPEFKGRTE
jgi:alpha-glucosidase